MSALDSPRPRTLFTALTLALAVATAAAGCSTNADDLVAPARACGNGVLDPGEACDTAVASGSAACPSSCDDGDACTVDTMKGDACAATCVHSSRADCKAVGDGGGEKGDSGSKGGDGAYGEGCKGASECASSVCYAGMCTKACTLSGSISQCGAPGHFCFETDSATNVCYPLVPTGADTDDQYIGVGVPYTGRVHFANDADAFVADLAIGIYAVTVTPTDVPSQIDLAIDIYDGSATKLGTMNSTGVGETEGSELTAKAGGRTFFVVRAANSLQGNYSIQLAKKP